MNFVVEFENLRKNKPVPVRYRGPNEKKLSEFFSATNDFDDEITRNMDRVIVNIYETLKNIFECRFIKIKLSAPTESDLLHLYFNANIGENVYCSLEKAENQQFDRSFIFQDKVTGQILTGKHEKILKLSAKSTAKIAKKYNIFKILKTKRNLLNLGDEIIGQIFPTSADYFEFSLAKSIFKKDITAVKFIKEVFGHDFKKLCNKKSGEMPLHVAASNGSKGIIRELLNGGASVDVKDANGNTALHCSINARQFGVAEVGR